jgi:Tfp pilus assembly protein PilF
MTNQETTNFLILAERYFNRQEYSNAEFILQKILKINYVNSRANELLGYISAAKGDSSIAKEYLSIACAQQCSTPS